MYKIAYSNDETVVFYFDSAGHKYVASGGSLAWRLNNPGLVPISSRWLSKDSTIGHYGRYAIFATPEKGHQALADWLKLKTYFNGSLKTIAKHYRPDDATHFADQLSALTDIAVQTKVKALSPTEFNRLLLGIEKLCDYSLKGNEQFNLLPKILGKIEKGDLEYALDLLHVDEAARIRVFTFGGGSFIAPGKSHPDSHNYASVADHVCRGSSPNLQLLAIQRYDAYKTGLTDVEMIQQWAFRDAIFHLDTLNPDVIQRFTEGRIKYYLEEFKQLENLTILDSDPESRWKHEFASDCYQKAVQTVIQKYQEECVQRRAS